MNKTKKFKKKFIVFGCAVGILLVAVPSTVYGYKNYNYNKYFNEGTALIKKDNLDKAVDSFNKSLCYKNKKSSIVQQKLKLVDKIKKSKLNYETGISKMNEKKYLEAIENFKQISKEDTARYKKLASKVNECNKLYIDDNMCKAKEQAKENKYTEAIAFLNNVIKFDPSFTEATSLKDQYNKEIQKIKDEEEKKAAQEKKAAEEKIRLAEAAKKKAVGEVAKKPSENVASQGNKPIVPDIISLNKPEETLYVPNQVNGIEAIKNEYKKMGFVFQSDTTAMYNKNGIEIGLVNRGDFWQVSIKTWGDTEENLFENCMTVILGRDKAFSNLIYIDYAIDNPDSVFQSPNVKTFINEDTLILYVYIPK